MSNEKDDEEEELYCVCKKSYEEGQFMIECGKCNEWFHGSCIGIEEYQAQDIDVYHCPKCQPIYGPLVYSFLDVTYENGVVRPIKVKRRRNVSKHNYKEIHEGTKQISAGSVMFVRQLKTRKFLDGYEIIHQFENGKSLSANYFQEHGFNVPILIYEKSGLGLVVPPSNFTVYDVEKRVGSLFEIHVIDVSKQEDLRMKMREWTEYYNSPVRGKILNVISLEFSNTSLSDLVMAPELVRNISWVENVWPKNPSEDSPHTMPIVAKYCLMSVKDCYTDFHVDFGGTSVWYHLIRGEKIFYLIEPTEENLKKFEQWVSSSDQGQVFFGDRVSKCYTIHIKQGNTLLIPTGWIHAVLTPKDSLVFGGNFLHSFDISLQQKIYKLEKGLNTPLQFLFPNYETTNWYAARSILKKIKDIHGAGVRMPDFLHQGVKCMIVALRSWLVKKGDLVKYHKLQIPIEINPLKLIKSLEKALKVDMKINPSNTFPSGQLSSPALLSVKSNKTVLKLKIPRKSESETSGTSSPEHNSVDKLERKKEKLRRKQQRIKEEMLSKGHLPSIKLNLTSSSSSRTRQFSIDDSESGEDTKDNLPIKLKLKDGKISSNTIKDSIQDSSIKLKLSLAAQRQSSLSDSSSPDVTKTFDQPFTTSGSSSWMESGSTINNKRDHPVAAGFDMTTTPVDIKAEIEATKKDLFQSTEKPKGLYFMPQDTHNDCTVKPVTFNPSKNFPTKPKVEHVDYNSDNKGDDGGGYVIDYLPKPKTVVVTKRKHSDGEDSDYDPSVDTYYQDAEFVYPRIDVTSAITQDDFSWKPGQRKKPKISISDKKSRLNSVTKKDESDDFFAPDNLKDIKKSPKKKPNDVTNELGPGRPLADPTASVTNKQPIKDKSKKGFATAKQRLGKLLKLDKTGSRYVR